MGQRESARAEILQRKENTKNVWLQQNHPDVSIGCHTKGSPLVAKEKACILNLYQSYVNDTLPIKQAREETARRLQLS